MSEHQKDEHQKNILLIGYGNPGRLDDGLGPALAEAVEQQLEPDSFSVTIDSNYQLNVEDASAIAEHRIVIFADASVNGEEPFFFKEIQPKSAVSFSTHSIDPQAVLALAQEIFKAKTIGFALGIRGYAYNEFGQELSPQAQANLAAAVTFVISFIKEGSAHFLK